jgi:hypothetical protein
MDWCRRQPFQKVQFAGDEQPNAQLAARFARRPYE